MKTVFVSLLLIASTAASSQKQPSPQAITELVNKVSLFLGVEKNERVRVALNKYIAAYNKEGASKAMANLSRDLEGRKDLMMVMTRATADRESFMETLNAMDVSDKSSLELTEYLFPKDGPPKIPIADTNVVREEPVKAAEPFVKKPPSKKFFDGRKTFCDSSGTSFYRVVIIKDDVLLTKYRGTPKNDMSAVVSKGKAFLNGEDMVSAETRLIDFKYENNIFYEKDLSEQWVKYVECPDE
jgi:hypothetical protein